jgi:hypothetical protein
MDCGGNESKYLPLKCFTRFETSLPYSDLTDLIIFEVDIERMTSREISRTPALELPANFTGARRLPARCGLTFEGYPSELATFT